VFILEVTDVFLEMQIAKVLAGDRRIAGRLASDRNAGKRWCPETDRYLTPLERPTASWRSEWL
jgi:hypothetical protein